MYILQPEQFCNFQIDTAPQFVHYWKQFSEDRVRVLGSEELIDYERELNLSGRLSEENVRRLLRWKDPRYLTHIVQSGTNAGTANLRVQRVLDRLDTLNAFRTDNLGVQQFRDVTATIFSQGWTWRIFLFHICRPTEYPIADQHVFRTFECQTGCTLEDGWEKYLAYREYFFEVVAACHFPDARDEHIVVRNHKQVDDALLAFGRFLQQYGSSSIRP